MKLGHSYTLCGMSMAVPRGKNLRAALAACLPRGELLTGRKFVVVLDQDLAVRVEIFDDDAGTARDAEVWVCP